MGFNEVDRELNEDDLRARGVVACHSFPGARRDACGGGDDAVGGLPETKVIAVASTRRNEQR